jgi:alpha/beta superfamily hydrolase
MKSKWMAFWILIELCTFACASKPAPVVGTATPSPAPAKLAPRSVTFNAPDGAVLEGTLYGLGETAVIFSVMGNCKRGWEEMADLVGQQAMMALTYSWRGCRESGGVDDEEIKKFVEDLRGAVLFMRDQGAKKMILAGASLGGLASAKLAAESGADGLIVIASPAGIPDWGFEVETADLHTDIPKLFITSENDEVVAPNSSRALFDLAAGPKEWQTFPGTAHGTDLFETESGQALEELILNFIFSIAPPELEA